MAAAPSMIMVALVHAHTAAVAAHTVIDADAIAVHHNFEDTSSLDEVDKTHLPLILKL